MKRKTAKPTYGNSKGAKPDILNVDRNSRNKSTPQKYAKSEKFTDREYLQLRSDAASIHSLPRTIFKFSVIGLITAGLLTHTKIGKSITTKISEHLAFGQKKVEIDRALDRAKEGKQKAFDERFDDAWEKAGGKSDQKNK
jgi:hypothetical protein